MMSVWDIIFKWQMLDYAMQKENMILLLPAVTPEVKWGPGRFVYLCKHKRVSNYPHLGY